MSTLPATISIILSFALIRQLLHKYPRILHKKRFVGEKGSCTLIAHRGSREEGLPENTLAAFGDAIKCGADVIEFDVWLTKDNRVVVFHDKTLSRMTNGMCKHDICETNYSELPELSPPAGQSERLHEIDSSVDKAASWRQIPLLSEVLNIVPSHVAIIVEVNELNVQTCNVSIIFQQIKAYFTFPVNTIRSNKIQTTS